MSSVKQRNEMTKFEVVLHGDETTWDSSLWSFDAVYIWNDTENLRYDDNYLLLLLILLFLRERVFGSDVYSS